jgi:hypothetical protein
MRLPTVAPAFLMVCFLLAGCAAADEDDDGGAGATTSTTTPPSDPCPTVTESTTVPAWTKHGGQWGDILAQEGHTGVVCGKATSALDFLVNDLLGPFSDVEVNVSFNMLQGDSGAGIVLHFADDGDYNIVRYSPREQGWHLFTLVDGNRQKQDAASVTPPTTNPDLRQWVTLKVRSEAGHVTAFDGSTKVIDFTLPEEASHNGRVGFFLRDDGMAALFDDFSATAL